MLENEIQKEVQRIGSLANRTEAPKEKKKISGLVEYYSEPLYRRIIDAIFEGDLASVSNSLINEILIPKTKDILADLFIGGIEKAIYGDEAQQVTRTGPSRRSSYDAYYGRGVSGGGYYQSPSSPPSGKTKVRWDRLVMKTRPEAIELTNSILSDISKYGCISVSDVYDYVADLDEEIATQIETEFPDNNWGWDRKLKRIPIESVPQGYLLKLPKPIQIN